MGVGGVDVRLSSMGSPDVGSTCTAIRETSAIRKCAGFIRAIGAGRFGFGF